MLVTSPGVHSLSSDIPATVAGKRRLGVAATEGCSRLVPSTSSAEVEESFPSGQASDAPPCHGVQVGGSLRGAKIRLLSVTDFPSAFVLAGSVPSCRLTTWHRQGPAGSRALDPVRGMSARSQDTMACINIQATL